LGILVACSLIILLGHSFLPMNLYLLRRLWCRAAFYVVVCQAPCVWAPRRDRPLRPGFSDTMSAAMGENLFPTSSPSFAVPTAGGSSGVGHSVLGFTCGCASVTLAAHDPTGAAAAAKLMRV